MIDWKQKLKNQWVQIEISRVQPGKPCNLLPLGPFPFQYSSLGLLLVNRLPGVNLFDILFKYYNEKKALQYKSYLALQRSIEGL